VSAHESTAFTTDFDQLYRSAVILLAGGNPYRALPPNFRYPLFYQLPAALVAVPFTMLPISLARPAFDIAVGWVFAMRFGATRRMRCSASFPEPTSSPRGRARLPRLSWQELSSPRSGAFGR
jgi:hypothetical protein